MEELDDDELLKLVFPPEVVEEIKRQLGPPSHDSPDIDDDTGQPRLSQVYNPRYFYEEHTCPTNWMRDVLMVSQDGDPDPHGPWDHVRSIEIPRDFNTNDDDAVMGLFSELKP